MDKIKFKVAYGDEDKDVEISAPNGGGSHYHIYIDLFYYGAIILIADQWTIALNQKGEQELDATDRMILIDLVVDHL